ncbi:hypothetical protein ACI65C_009426 [Semiaphis heraclei]
MENAYLQSSWLSSVPQSINSYNCKKSVTGENIAYDLFRLLSIHFSVWALVWGGKKSLEGSTKLNYKLLGILPAKLLYMSIVLLFTIKKIIRKNTNTFDFLILYLNL